MFFSECIDCKKLVQLKVFGEIRSCKTEHTVLFIFLTFKRDFEVLIHIICLSNISKFCQFNVQAFWLKKISVKLDFMSTLIEYFNFQWIYETRAPNAVRMLAIVREFIKYPYGHGFILQKTINLSKHWGFHLRLYWVLSAAPTLAIRGFFLSLS